MLCMFLQYQNEMPAESLKALQQIFTEICTEMTEKSTTVTMTSFKVCQDLSVITEH